METARTPPPPRPRVSGLVSPVLASPPAPPVPRTPTEILYRPLAAQLGTAPGSEMKGAARGLNRSLRARGGTYLATGSCSSRLRSSDTSPAPFSSLTEALPGGRTRLPTSHQPQPRRV